MSGGVLEEEDTVVSLQDVLEESRELEETANAVLGGSDDSSCTYSKGYVDRQALYACATCSKARDRSPGKTEAGSGSKPREEFAGVCLACSLHCHEGHDLFELYTKRQFRCDCGNSKFPDRPCSLCPEKTPTNPLNSYNHNFRGLYCTCNRPYPDPEDEVEDEMIQCCVCEDWFHSRHLKVAGRGEDGEPPGRGEGREPPGWGEGREPPGRGEGREPPGRGEDREPPGRGEDREPPGRGEGREPPSRGEDREPTGQGEDREPPDGFEEMACNGCMTSLSFLEAYTLVPVVRVVKSEECEEVKVDLKEGAAGESGGSCDLVKRRRKRGMGVSRGRVGYFGLSWRSQLCRCSDCMAVYKKASCLYLLDEADTISSYEARATSHPSSHEAAMTAFSSNLDRVQQVEAIHQYNDMKTELVGFLQEFAKERKVVSRRDVETFFEEMQVRKRRRLETGEGVPPASCHF